MSANSNDKVIRKDNGRRDEMANALRALAMNAVQQANSGHPGSPMGLAGPRPLRAVQRPRCCGTDRCT